MPNRRDLANAIRALSMDAVQKANSGHPGMPMGMADIAEVLWNDFLNHNPANPNWINRDRFILSNGHGCMLHYSLLHLAGYDMSIEDLKSFRQMHSKTPGHPEYGCAPGIETTTGPLGQGIANGVGMAIAGRILAAEFNREDHDMIDHFTYVFAGDGCMMEGVSHEACSFAGTLGLGKLIVFWDDNGISIDGKVQDWFTDDTPKRFEAYGWQVIPNIDGHNPDAVKDAITKARVNTDKPTLICCRTEIAHGSPNMANSHKAHGAPLGDEEISETRKNIGWDYAPFVIPNEISTAWDAKEKGQTLEATWNDKFMAYKDAYPDLAEEFLRRVSGELPENFQDVATHFIAEENQKAESMATRKASLQTLNAFGPLLPEFVGGSADLSGSNLTFWSDSKPISHSNFDGNYIYYGVREFGMSAIMNGIALHGGFIPYGGTFLVFTDYARNAVRLSALMKQRVIYVYSHDSIGLGEDGPTHQPVEHASMLRMTPNMSVWRPCDTVETAVAWQHAVQRTDGPTSLLTSRQTLPFQTRDDKTIENVQKGGYVLRDCEGTPECILIATGSEVGIAVEAFEKLSAENKKVRVVSMPCANVFDAQSDEYKESVLPRKVRNRVAIEAAATAFWYKYVGLDGQVIGMDRFGESAPAEIIFNELGFNVENIINKVKGV